MKILAVESSCDETAVAVVEDGRRILADCIASQVALHREYGGVVPEIASRKHIEEGNRTLAASLEGWSSTIEQHPHVRVSLLRLTYDNIKKLVCQVFFCDFS